MRVAHYDRRNRCKSEDEENTGHHFQRPDVDTEDLASFLAEKVGIQPVRLNRNLRLIRQPREQTVFGRLIVQHR